LITKKTKHFPFLTILLAAIIILTGCSRVGQALDPAVLGYDMEVTYNALGGLINQREIRLTNYADNSLIFEPRGSSNLLVEPIKTNYTLAGWYTDVTEIPGEDGEEPEYKFDPQDRWDFNVDRVTEDMTLYARWVNQATAQYIDAKTDEVIFSKDLTSSSPLAPLSETILDLVGRTDATFLGYFQENLDDEIDFDAYEFVYLLPTEKQLYDQLAEEFPENIVTFEEVEEEVEVEETKIDTAAAEELEDELEDNIEQENDSPWLFLNELGYDLNADEDEIAEIRYRKNEIIEEYISRYEDNNKQNHIYLVYEDGLNITVENTQDLDAGGNYSFKNVGEEGSYIFESDLNFGDANFSSVDEFSGLIDGQNHVLSNIHLKLTFSKRDALEGGSGALFKSLSKATIKNITFKDMVLEISAPAGVDVTAATLALTAEDSIIENVTFDGLTIKTGNSDNGRSNYTISDFVLDDSGLTVKDVNATNINYEVSEFANIQSAF